MPKSYTPVEIGNIEITSIKSRQNVLDVDINYPRTESSRYDTLQIGLCEVRAADSIRVTYHFDKDGWQILQEKHVTAETGSCSLPTGEWVEVAFVPSWGLEETIPRSDIEARLKEQQSP